MTKLYVECGSSMLGPIDSKEVIELIRKGEVTRASKISIGESDEWRDAGSLKQLEPFFAEYAAAQAERKREEQKHKAETVKVVAEKTDDAERIGKAVEMALLRTKSYSNQVAALVVLYFMGWLPGLILNLVWYNEAVDIRNQTGIEIRGTKQLRNMFIINLLLVIVIALYIIGPGW